MPCHTLRTCRCRDARQCVSEDAFLGFLDENMPCCSLRTTGRCVCVCVCVCVCERVCVCTCARVNMCV